MRWLHRVSVSVALASALVITGCAGPTGQQATVEGRETVTLTFAYGFPTTHSNNAGLWMFEERLEENAPWIEIDFKGGPEVIDPNLLIEGVSAGVFDGGSLPGDYYVDQLPAMEMSRFTPYTPTEERERGINEVYDEIHQEQLGLRYIGRSVAGMPQVMLLNEPLETIDLQGQSIRTSAAMSQLVEDINGVPVDLPADEVYTAIERSVVLGATWSSVGPTSLGLDEVVGYDVAPRFYESVANIVINEDTWGSLDAESRQSIEDTMAEIEPEIFEHYVERTQEETQGWRDAGVELNELSEVQANQLMEIAYREGWEEGLDWDRILTTSPAAEDLKRAYEEGLAGDLSGVVPGGADEEQAQERAEEALEEQDEQAEE